MRLSVPDNKPVLLANNLHWLAEWWWATERHLGHALERLSEGARSISAIPGTWRTIELRGYRDGLIHLGNPPACLHLFKIELGSNARNASCDFPHNRLAANLLF